VQEIKKFFAGFSVSTNSNPLSQFSREYRGLPWQPNSDKKAKLRRF